MHAYSTDSEERRSIPFWVGIISIGCAYLLHLVIDWATQQFHLDWLWVLEIPSVLGFYKILIDLFDSRLWRWSIWRWLGLVKVPDIAGVWTGQGEAVIRGKPVSFDVTLHIEQSWSQIAIRGDFEGSRSHSLTASLLLNSPEGTQLIYVYQNEPKPKAVRTMVPHRGVSRMLFRLQKAPETMEVDYFTGRGRETHGGFQLQRQPK